MCTHFTMAKITCQSQTVAIESICEYYVYEKCLTLRDSPLTFRTGACRIDFGMVYAGSVYS